MPVPSIAPKIHRLKANLPCWILVLLLALGLKFHYSRASSDELNWILRPTAALTEVLTSETFGPEAGAGFVNADRRLVIAPACAGVNFLIAAFALAAFSGLRRIDGRLYRLAWVAVALGAAFLLTVTVNAVRIALAAWLYETAPTALLGPQSMHLIAGVVLYLGALSVFHTSLASFFDGPAVTRRPAAGLVPLGWYLAVTLAVPLVNGALGRDAAGFLHHAVGVLSTGLSVFLVVFLLKSLLRRRSVAGDPNRTRDRIPRRLLRAASATQNRTIPRGLPREAFNPAGCRRP